MGTLSDAPRPRRTLRSASTGTPANIRNGIMKVTPEPHTRANSSHVPTPPQGARLRRRSTGRAAISHKYNRTIRHDDAQPSTYTHSHIRAHTT